MAFRYELSRPTRHSTNGAVNDRALSSTSECSLTFLWVARMPESIVKANTGYSWSGRYMFRLPTLCTIAQATDPLIVGERFTSERVYRKNVCAIQEYSWLYVGLQTIQALETGRGRLRDCRSKCDLYRGRVGLEFVIIWAKVRVNEIMIPLWSDFSPGCCDLLVAQGLKAMSLCRSCCSYLVTSRLIEEKAGLADRTGVVPGMSR